MIRLSAKFLIPLLAAPCLLAGACSKPPEEQATGGTPVQTPQQPRQSEATTAEPPLDADVAASLREFANALYDSAATIAGDSPRVARDRAGVRMSRHGAVIDAAAEVVEWTCVTPDDRAEAAGLGRIALAREVWARSFLSCFEFDRPFALRSHGSFAVLEIPARLRKGLEPRDYPYPVWHSSDLWRAWHTAVAIRFVLSGDTVVESQIVSADTATESLPAAPQWDGRWTWADERGAAQPRAAQIAYVLSPDNPHVRPIDRAYQRLADEFQTRGCLACHQPDNRAGTRAAYVLGSPALAVAMRSKLVDALDSSGDDSTADSRCTIRTLALGETAGEVRRLLERFRTECDHAFEYESIYIIRPEEYPDRPWRDQPASLPPP